MSAQTYRRPSEVAARLGVSVSTLRRWAQQFAVFLSSTAQPSDGDEHRHRRYADEDLATLITVKGLLAEGYAYDQVRRRLQALRVGDAPEREAYALVTSEEPLPTVAPAVTVLSDTLHTVADGQQLLLNSQQANRDLLSVAIQDNFNLKTENGKLRDRMLDLERSLSELRRQEAAHREPLEARLQAVEDTLAALVEQWQSYAEEPRRGFWSRLWGR
jgi:DNA-binding transcriptional MerR regulator